MSQYPRREPYFAHRFVRILHKSCAAQDIGQTACYLCCIIAHTEDAGRYAGPARFWNSQLMETMGFRSPKQLVAARDKAVAAGWLCYERDGTRAVGHYHVTIPGRFSGLSDAPIEPMIHSENGTNSGTNQDGFVPNSEREGDGKRNEKVTESGKHSIPIPIPNTQRRARNVVPPSLEDVTAYCRERGKGIDPQEWFDHYKSNGWRVGRTAMKDWQAAVRQWERRQPQFSRGNGKPTSRRDDDSDIERGRRILEELKS